MRISSIFAVFLLGCKTTDEQPAVREPAPAYPTDSSKTDVTVTATIPDGTTDTAARADGADERFDFDTGRAHLDLFGSGVVSGDTYSGQESYLYTDLRTGRPMCKWTFDTFDWATAGEPGAPPSSALPCTDADGQACDFAFEIRQVNGRYAGACSGFDAPPVHAGTDRSVGFGYIDDYSFYGVDLGPFLMYFVDYSTWYPSLPPDEHVNWIALEHPTSFDGTEWHYEIGLGIHRYNP
jgi:hypothetical protein